ncbi:hypothetical protein D3C78_1226340 [compost metagenome]
MLFELCKVLGPIAMISVLFEAITFIKINIIYNWRNPKRVNTKFLQIIEIVDHSSEITTVVCFQLIFIYILIICWISVFEAVCKREVYTSLIPIKIQLISCVGSRFYLEFSIFFM